MEAIQIEENVMKNRTSSVWNWQNQSLKLGSKVEVEQIIDARMKKIKFFIR